MKRWVLTLLLVGAFALAASSSSRADEGRLRYLLSQLADESPAPAMPRLLFRMAEDAEFARAVLERAGPAQRALTDSLLSCVAQTEPEARRSLPELHVVRDFGPPPEGRPPIWSELRWQGVQLLRRIAPDPSVGRDLRLQRDLARKEAAMVTGRSAEIAGLVLLFSEWWTERGDDPALTHDPKRIPDVSDWLAGLTRRTDESGAWEGVRMLADLDASPRRRNLVLRQLTPESQAHLAAECISVLRLDTVDLPGLGIEARHWNPDEQRLVGHDAPGLWTMALAVLDRITLVAASGTEVEEMVLDRLGWWRRARFEAQYWRDPRHAPTLDPWLSGVTRTPAQGGPTITSWVRSLYVTEGFRDLVVEQIDAEFSPLVAELVPLLTMSRDEAIEAGFDPAFRRLPLRARSPEDGIWVAIPWESAQELVRELLLRIAGEEFAPASTGDPDAVDAEWARWWRTRAHEPRWYRDPQARRPAPVTPDLDPPRARIR